MYVYLVFKMKMHSILRNQKDIFIYRDHFLMYKSKLSPPQVFYFYKKFLISYQQKKAQPWGKSS